MAGSGATDNILSSRSRASSLLSPQHQLVVSNDFDAAAETRLGAPGNMWPIGPASSGRHVCIARYKLNECPSTPRRAAPSLFEKDQKESKTRSCQFSFSSAGKSYILSHDPIFDQSLTHFARNLLYGRIHVCSPELATKRSETSSDGHPYIPSTREEDRRADMPAKSGGKSRVYRRTESEVDIIITKHPNKTTHSRGRTEQPWQICGSTSSCRWM